MTYEVNNVDLLWKQMRRDIKAEKLKISERYVTGVKINRPEDDLFGYQVADEISLNVQSSENIKSNLAYAKQIANSALSDTAFMKAELQNLRQLILRSRGKTQSSRDKVQQDVDATLARMENIVDNTFSGLHMLKGSATSVEVALDSKYYADPSNVPKITLAGQDLQATALTIDSLKVNTTEGLNSSDASPTLIKRDLKNIERINTAIQKTNDAQAAFASEANSIGSQERLVSRKIDALKAQYDDLVKADRAEELAKLKALEIKERLGNQSYGMTRGGGQSDMLNMFRRIS